MKGGLQKGIAMAGVLMWAVGLSIPVMLYLAKANADTNSSQDQKIYDIANKQATTDANVSNLTASVSNIDTKVTLLLEDRGYTKAMIDNVLKQKERLVGPQSSQN